MEFRVLNEREIPEAKALWRYCFEDSAEFTDGYFAHRAVEALGLFDSRLAAQLVVAPVEYRVRDQVIPGSIVSGVATRPELRGRGLAGRLMGEGLRRMRARGLALASLYPFEYGFYRRFGWAAGSDMLHLELPTERLPSARGEGEIEPLSLDRTETATRLSRAYAACFARYSGVAVRGAREFALRCGELALDGGYAALYRVGDVCEGYLLYRFDGDRIAVEEFGASTPRARLGLASLVAAHAPTHPRASLELPPDDPLYRMIPEPRGAARLEPHAMYRVLDVERLMRGFRAGRGEVDLNVEDREIPENSGTWRFHSDGGELVAERATIADAPRIGIGALAAWAVGYLSGSELRDAGEAIPAQAAGRMDALLPKQPVFLYEKY